MFKGTDLLDFIRYFSDYDDCLKYIADIKWPEDSFKFKKCGKTIFCMGKQNYNKKHMQDYLDECCYWFKSRNYLDTIFHKLTERLALKSSDNSATEGS